MKLDESEVQRILSSASLVLVGTVFGAFTNLFERVVIARLLSPAVFGDVNIALAILKFGVTMSLVGFNQGVPRFVSRYDDEREIRGVWLTGLLIPGGLSTLLVVLAIVFGVDSLLDLLFETPGSDLLLYLFVLGIPLSVGQMVAIGTIRGLENTIYKTYTTDLFLPLSRIGLLVVLLWAGFEVEAVGLAYVVAGVATLVLAHLLLNRLVPLVGSANLHVKEMVVFSLPLVVATVLSRMLTWTDTVMMGYFRSSFEVALYGAAYPLANGLVLLVGAFGFIYLPMTSRFDGDDQREKINSIFQLTTKWIYILTFPAFLTLAVFAEDVLRIVFGAEYTAGSLALTILACGFFFHAATGRNRETISALGVTKYIFYSNAVALALNVVLNLFLIPTYGVVGAAVASASSYVLLNAVVNAILKLEFDISPISPVSVRTFLLLPITLIPVAVAASMWIDLTTVTLPVFGILAAGATVLVVVLGNCLQPEDRVVLEFIEDTSGISVPLVRSYLPEGPETGGTEPGD